jgi:hypothetical protein
MSAPAGTARTYTTASNAACFLKETDVTVTTVQGAGHYLLKVSHGMGPIRTFPQGMLSTLVPSRNTVPHQWYRIISSSSMNSRNTRR